MAPRRPITGHPAFPLLAALWFAALLGLTVTVLPAPVIDRAAAALGIGITGAAARVAASGAAALIGALIGGLLARLLRGRHRREARPIYEEDAPPPEPAELSLPERRPLRVREELGDDLSADVQGMGEPAYQAANAMPDPPAPHMPVAPRAGDDLAGLLAQFDQALAAFRDTAARSDPVPAFLAQQAGGGPRPGPLPSTRGLPDHQAELRAALDKLAAMRRG